MELFCSCIKEQSVYPILIKHDGKSYLTLYYYTECSDSVLHKETKQILYFQSANDMEAFCKANALQIKDGIVEYDFDRCIENPIDYRHILDNWNLLNTLASTLGMYFEGNSKRNSTLYHLLFRLNTLVTSLPSAYKVSKKDHERILRVFKKQGRFFSHFTPYQELKP